MFHFDQSLVQTPHAFAEQHAVLGAHALQLQHGALSPGSPIPGAQVPQTARILSVTPPAIAHTEVPPSYSQPVTLEVCDPTGALVGQQLHFTTPSGQPMTVVVTEQVQPGSKTIVQWPAQDPQPCPLPLPALPATTSDEADHMASRIGWWVYAASLVCCCFFPLCSFAIWLGLAALYYCRADAERERRPRQRSLAQVAAITGCGACGCMAMAGLCLVAFVAVCGIEGELCPGLNLPDNIHNHTAPFGGRVNLTVQGLGCANGYGWDDNQRYLYQGATKDGRAYYRGEKNTDRYIYYDKKCDDKDVTRGAWILGVKPDVTLDHGLAPIGCWNDAHITSDGLTVPIGKRSWDWVWCGDHGRGSKIVDVKAEHPHGLHPWGFLRQVLPTQQPLAASHDSRVGSDTPVRSSAEDGHLVKAPTAGAERVIV